MDQIATTLPSLCVSLPLVRFPLDKCSNLLSHALPLSLTVEYLDVMVYVPHSQYKKQP